MKNLTRRTFLERTVTGVTGSVVPGLLAGCSSPGGLQRGFSGSVKILTLGDMHVVDSKTISYPRKVIQAMNNEGGDLVLVCGDLGSNRQRSELELAKDVLDELKMPYYPVLGNHDARYSGEKEEALFAEVFSLKKIAIILSKKASIFWLSITAAARTWQRTAFARSAWHG